MSFNEGKFNKESIHKKENDNEIDYNEEGLIGLEIEEPVIIQGDAFLKAKEIIANRIESVGGDVFSYAINCKAETIKAGQNVFDQANNCKAETIEAGGNAFLCAVSCEAKIVKAVKDAFWDAKNCKAGEVKTGHDAFSYAKNCEADIVEARWDAFWQAQNCEVKEVKVTGEAFSEAKKSLCTKKIKVKTIGKNSRGVVVLGKTEGKIFPSIILMNGKLKKEKPENIEKFFKQELKKSQQDKESVFDYLSYFNWEKETLEQGKEALKKRYDKIRDKQELLEELKEINFYLFIDDNSKREDIFLSFEKLRKVEKKTLLELNNHLSHFDKIRNYLSTLSIKDWIVLGKYTEFIDFNEEKLKEIENEIEEEFENLNTEIDNILKEPKKFEKVKTDKKTIKKVKKFLAKGEEIDKKLIKKELQKEIKNKKNYSIRKWILSSPKENVKNYLKNELKIEEKDITNDITFAARLHKILAEKECKIDKEILEQLIKEKEPLDWRENRDWLSKMKQRIDIESWLKPYSKEYISSINENYKTSLETKQKENKEEIIKHLKKAGLELSMEIEIREIEKIFSENKEKITLDLQRDIKTHFQAIKSLKSIEKSKLPKNIILETEENPLKAIQMGERVIGSCLKLRGGHEKSVVCNAVDINKKVVWAKDKEGRILGRILIGITDDGKLAGFKIYDNDRRINLKPCFKDFLFSLAKKLKTDLTSKGEIEELVGKDWYNDGIKKWDNKSDISKNL